MLASIKIKYIDDDGEQRTARAFQVTRKGAWDPPQKYRTFQVLHGDSAFAAQMMDSAYEDLQTWKRKYEPYVGMWRNFGDAFQQVVNQASEWADEYKPSGVASETDEALLKLLAWREECSGVLATWTGAREQMEFIMKAIGDAEAIFVKVSEHKERKCLKCSKPFMSVSVGNRLCKTCLNSKTISENNPNLLNSAIGNG